MCQHLANYTTKACFSQLPDDSETSYTQEGLYRIEAQVKGQY